MREGAKEAEASEGGRANKRGYVSIFYLCACPSVYLRRKCSEAARRKDSGRTARRRVRAAAHHASRRAIKRRRSWDQTEC